MNNFDYKNMTPFKWFVLENFPFIENDFDAINNYHLFSKVVEYLNKTIDNMNLTGEQMENVTNAMTELQNYINNLDLQEEVNNKLDEMVENGTLETLLNIYTIKNYEFRSRLYFSKIGRLNFTDYINNDFYGMQAGCYIGNNQYIFALIKNDNLGSARLFKIDFSSGMILSYNDVIGIFHANGCCLKDNKLYFTQSFDENNQNKYGIVEIDVTTLQITNTFEIDFNNTTEYQILAIGYDEKYNKFYLIARNYFYRTDTNFKVEELIYMEQPNARNSLIRQGGTFYEDYICYVANNENAIVCFNRDGTLHHIIDIGQQQLHNYFGEIENINVYDNVLYCNCNLAHVSVKNLSLLQFFKANLKSGGLPQLMSNNQGFQNNETVKITVNKTKYDTLTDLEKFTCDGTVAKPLESVAEALCYIDNKKHYEIDITDQQTEYEQDLGIYNKNITIKGNDCSVGSTKILGSNVNISNLYFIKASYRTPLFGEHDDYITPLYITGGSTVYLVNHVGYNYEKCIESGMIYPCIVQGSILNDNSINVNNPYKKFLTKIDNYIPLISGSTINTSALDKIPINKTNFSTYKDTSNNFTGNNTFDLTQIPLYTNSNRGFNMAINIGGIGNTDYHKFNFDNQSRFIVRFTASNIYGFQCQYTPSENTIYIKSMKWDFTQNKFVDDSSFNYYPFYEFDA